MIQILENDIIITDEQGDYALVNGELKQLTYGAITISNYKASFTNPITVEILQIVKTITEEL